MLHPSNVPGYNTEILVQKASEISAMTFSV